MSASALSRILLVEDEPDIQMIARLTLESVGGIAVHISGSGQEALKAAGTHAPDLILLDVIMLGMDGLAVFRALKAPYERCQPVQRLGLLLPSLG